MKTLAFHGESQVEVEMKIDRKATRYIHGDALAKIGSDGLIGSKIVVLYGDTPGAPALKDGDVLATGVTVSTEDMMSMLQETNTNLLAISADMKGISGGLGRGEGTIGKLLKDDGLYTNVTDTVATLSTASENARTVTASVSEFTAQLNEKGNLPNDLVTDRTTYASLTTTVDRLQNAGDRASDLMDGLAKGAEDPRSPIGTLMHDEQAGADLKVALDNMNRASLLLTEDLEALQHNFLTRGYFRKKEKAAAKALAKADSGAPEASPASGR